MAVNKTLHWYLIHKLIPHMSAQGKEHHMDRCVSVGGWRMSKFSPSFKNWAWKHLKAEMNKMKKNDGRWINNHRIYRYISSLYCWFILSLYLYHECLCSLFSFQSDTQSNIGLWHPIHQRWLSPPLSFSPWFDLTPFPPLQKSVGNSWQ